MSEITFDPADLKYDAQGLIPAVLQHHETREVLMLGYMNRDTLRQTLELGQAVFWSRSRQEVWHKGATSGDYVNVHRVTTDCDVIAYRLRPGDSGLRLCLRLADFSETRLADAIGGDWAEINDADFITGQVITVDGGATA